MMPQKHEPGSILRSPKPLSGAGAFRPPPFQPPAAAAAPAAPAPAPYTPYTTPGPAVPASAVRPRFSSGDRAIRLAVCSVNLLRLAARRCVAGLLSTCLLFIMRARAVGLKDLWAIWVWGLPGSNLEVPTRGQKCNATTLGFKRLGSESHYPERGPGAMAKKVPWSYVGYLDTDGAIMMVEMGFY